MVYWNHCIVRQATEREKALYALIWLLCELTNSQQCSKTSSFICKRLSHLLIQSLVRRGVCLLMHLTSIGPQFWHRFRYNRGPDYFRLKSRNNSLFSPDRSMEAHGGGLRLTKNHLPSYRRVQGLTICCWMKKNLNFIQTTGIWYVYKILSETIQTFRSIHLQEWNVERCNWLRFRIQSCTYPEKIFGLVYWADRVFQIQKV